MSERQSAALLQAQKQRRNKKCANRKEQYDAAIPRMQNHPAGRHSHGSSVIPDYGNDANRAQAVERGKEARGFERFVSAIHGAKIQSSSTRRSRRCTTFGWVYLKSMRPLHSLPHQ